MANLSEQQIREQFRKMNAKGTSTNNVATAARRNSADPYKGDGFIDAFEEMLDKQFEIASEVHKKFGA